MFFHRKKIDLKDSPKKPNAKKTRKHQNKLPGLNYNLYSRVNRSVYQRRDDKNLKKRSKNTIKVKNVKFDCTQKPQITISNQTITLFYFNNHRKNLYCERHFQFKFFFKTISVANKEKKQQTNKYRRHLIIVLNFSYFIISMTIK